VGAVSINRQAHQAVTLSNNNVLVAGGIDNTTTGSLGGSALLSTEVFSPASNGWAVGDAMDDPHNLGACLRCADAAGVDAVVVPKDKSADLSATVRKVACGAAESVPFVRVTNVARFLRALKEQGVWLYGAAGEASRSLYEVDFDGPVALVMGAEGSGLRRLTREHCDFLVHLPMAGTVSSLNVSVAAGVCLYEIRRQRRVRCQ